MTSREGSLGRRLLLITALLLLMAFGVTIAVLDYIFRQSAERAIADQLETQVYALIGAAEPDARGDLGVPLRLLEPRLRNPGSGLYAEILDGSGLPLWRSPSAVGFDLAAGTTLGAGERVHRRHVTADGDALLIVGFGIRWQLDGDNPPAFQVYVASDLAPYRAQLAQFRRQLFGWFGGVMCLLLVALWLALRRSLAPLRRMAAEIDAIERGARDALGGGYPRELAGVGRGLNALLHNERQRMARYRTTMDDLAHSLKTPVAVMRAELDGGQPPDRQVLAAQLSRMQNVVDYQLRRAVASGPRSLAAVPVAIAPLVEDIAASLRKLHAGKAVDWHFEGTPGLCYPAEQGDLYEIVGNLLDNAWKWSRSVIAVSAAPLPAAGGMRLVVDDDGPGIPPDEARAVLGRGVRAGQRGDVPGQGIGLAVVGEIVDLYGGQLSVGASPAGGARLTVDLPPRPAAQLPDQGLRRADRAR